MYGGGLESPAVSPLAPHACERAASCHGAAAPQPPEASSPAALNAVSTLSGRPLTT